MACIPNLKLGYLEGRIKLIDWIRLLVGEPSDHKDDDIHDLALVVGAQAGEQARLQSTLNRNNNNDTTHGWNEET